MKKTNILSVLLLAFVAFSCNDNEDNPLVESEQVITEEEAVELVESSLAEESAGLAKSSYDYTKSYEEGIAQNIQCDNTIQDDFNYTNNGTFAEVNYNFMWEYTISCNALSIPQSASLNVSGSGIYTTPKITSDDSSSLSAQLSGLQPTSSNIIYNGTYERSGTQQVTTNQVSKTITTEFNAAISDLTVTKSDYTVSSGSGTFTLSGTNDGESFSFEGSITFNGDGTATIVINGNAYTIDIN